MDIKLQKGSRSRLLAGVIFALLFIFVSRLFYIQILQHDYYKSLADSEQVRRLAIPASRGVIYALDRDKPTKLVMNETVYTAFVDPQIVDEPDKIASNVKRIANDKAREGIEEMLKKTSSRYQIVATKLTRQQADELKKDNLKGLGFQAVSQRVYPEGALASQLLGFVDFEGKGQYGVEGALNTRLTGIDGMLQSVTDVRDVPLTIGDRNVKIPKKDGDNVVLSIDRNVQAYVENAILTGINRSGAKNASVIVMNPQNGQVMAMANYPSYAPAEFTKVTDVSLFNNPSISTPYEPGSVVKTFTLATGIDKGVITPETTYNNTDSVVIEDRTIKNAAKGHTGEVSMQTAYNWSLNTGMVEVMKLLGGGSISKQSRDTLYDYFYNRLNLGQRTGVELTSESKGTLISPDEQEGNAVRYSNMSFGQGMEVTPIQVASAYSAVINGGTYYQPTVVAGVMNDKSEFEKSSPKVKKANVISQTTSQTLRNMASTARSTQFSRLDKPGYVIGGKTGTSETIENGRYVNNQTIGSYVGFGGNDTPYYVIMVQVSGKDQNLGGSGDAMPIFTDISNWLIDYLKIQPKG